MDHAEWEQLLLGQAAIAPADFITEAYEMYGTASQPVRVGCSDGLQYVVKGIRAGVPRDKTPTAEQIVAELGQLLAAPIPPTPLLSLTNELQSASPLLSHFAPGTMHASLFDAECGGREGFARFEGEPNRSRFAALAILYTWAGAGDHQFLYRSRPPYEVISVDHGHFFGGPIWNDLSFATQPAIAGLDPAFDAINLQEVELTSVFERLEAVSVNQIGGAVARPPATWGVTMAERVALCIYLSERREHLLQRRSGK